jgi:hypothetical protein
VELWPSLSPLLSLSLSPLGWLLLSLWVLL